MREYGSGSEGILERVERILTGRGPVPVRGLSGESGEWNREFGVVVDEASVEICEAKERLYVAYISWAWPVLNGLDFRFVHLETFGSADVA